MAWVAVMKFRNEECIFQNKPEKNEFGEWSDEQTVEGEWYDTGIILPYGTIEKLIGIELTCKDNPVELTFALINNE